MTSYTITITEPAKSIDEMAVLLERIAELVLQGYTSGYGPDWELHETCGRKDCLTCVEGGAS